MKVKNLLIEKQQERIEELKKRLDDHDCHLGPEDGCECILIREELDGPRAYEQDSQPF